jgi:hypothetical protein
VHLLNYSHSRNPTRVCLHTHRHVRVLNAPHISDECWRVHILFQYRILTNSVLRLSYNFSNAMLNITHLNEVHYHLSCTYITTDKHYSQQTSSGHTHHFGVKPHSTVERLNAIICCYSYYAIFKTHNSINIDIQQI